MKKTLFLILAALTLFTFKGFAEEDSLLTDNRTYYYILEKCEYSTRMIDKKYVKGNILEDILNNLFATDISFGFEPYDDISGEELLDVLENDLKLPVDFIENKPSLKKRILTYPVLFETLDYYFDEIIKIQGLKREALKSCLLNCYGNVNVYFCISRI